MRAITQQDIDIKNPPAPITTLLEKTAVNKITMQYHKKDNLSLAYDLSLRDSKLGGIG